MSEWIGKGIGNKKKLSVVISNRNDTAMLVVTIRSCIEEFKAVDGKCEIVVVDNSDSNIYDQLQGMIPGGYVREGTINVLRQESPCLFEARDEAVRQSSGEYVLCLDSHMLCGRDMIRDLVEFMDRRSGDETLGFAHAPISWAHQHERVAKHDRDVRTHELGGWNTKYFTERTITWKGMPWICRKEFFLSKEKGVGIGGYGSLSKHMISWGGGDMFIGVKPWLLGFKNWAVPCSPGIHIGPFPKHDIAKGTHETIVAKPGDGYRYRLYAASGNYPHAFGFLVACYVLGGVPMMERNKKIISERFGRYIKVDKWWDKAIELGREEREWLVANQVMSFEEWIAKMPWEDQQ